MTLHIVMGFALKVSLQWQSLTHAIKSPIKSFVSLDLQRILRSSTIRFEMGRSS